MDFYHSGWRWFMSTAAANPVEIGKVGELKPGEMKMFLVRGREILLARVDDNYYAANNRCPHMGGNLSHGKLEGTIVTCPRHQSQFDLKDGHVVRWTIWPAPLVAVDRLRSRTRPLWVYPVIIEDNKIIVKI
jgi:3-phenylpropionate/trans-cinnamate dioxygenase ferredoxin component